MVKKVFSAKKKPTGSVFPSLAIKHGQKEISEYLYLSFSDILQIRQNISLKRFV